MATAHIYLCGKINFVKKNIPHAACHSPTPDPNKNQHKPSPFLPPNPQVKTSDSSPWKDRPVESCPQLQPTLLSPSEPLSETISTLAGRNATQIKRREVGCGTPRPRSLWWERQSAAASPLSAIKLLDLLKLS